ncbi:hypothetical protein [Pseudarthrobacter sp. LT1]|uniref:hypothetical protein n=1 Tax=Pseudarthrobacter sp. LT1 TaxID=3111450 RepID=UPI002D77EECA|nr:hypothetical protein [Pseudarthrobacter sp. LT1]WRT12529.1 hypothetical protein VIK36_14290 [Pseudarthrobacter sp. LT1]
MRESLRDDESAFRQDIEKWALAAVPVLQDVAGTYGGFITYKALATRVFEETKTSTRMLVPNFSSRLLNRVIRLCLENNLPALTSLVVSATDGTVGTGFDAALRGLRTGGPEYGTGTGTYCRGRATGMLQEVWR